MSDLSVRFLLFLLRHRAGALTLTAILAAGAALLGSRLTLDEDFTRMLPMSDRVIARQIEALKHLRQADRLYIDVQTSAVDPERLTAAADQMYELLQEIMELGDFRYAFEGAQLQEILENMRDQLPALLGSNDLLKLEGRLQPSAIEQRLTWFKRAMSQPQGLMLTEVALRDPVGLQDVVNQRLYALQVGAGDAKIANGRITSADGRHVLISAEPSFRPSDLARSQALVAKVLEAAREVEAKHPANSVRIAFTGAHRVALDNASLIREDSTRTSVIATFAVAGLMIAAYRQRWLGLLGLLPTVFGVLGAVTAFYWAGDPVSAVALGFGSILIGVTVDYGIYVLYQADELRPDTRPELARMVARLAPTITFGALTTMVAFLVMFVSPISGHRQLGLFGATSVAAAALFSMSVLPLLIPVGSAKPAARLPLSAVVHHVLIRRRQHASMAVFLCAGLCLLAATGLFRLRFSGDFNRLNGVTPETRRDEEAVRATWEKSLALSAVVIRGTDRETALQKNEQLCGLLESLQEKRVIDGFSSLAPLLPSEQTRRANVRAWQEFWTAARQQSLSNSLAIAAASLGMRTAAFRPFLEGVSASMTNTTLAADPPVKLDRWFKEYWLEREGSLSLCTLVKAKDRRSFLQLEEAVLQAIPDALLMNKAALGEEIARVAKRTLPVFIGLVVALNALLLLLFLGRLELVAITLLPMAVGVFWTLGALGLLGMPIDMSNFIFVTFVIGVGGDYSLFLVAAELATLRGYKDNTAVTGGAVTVCAGTTLLGVGVLVLARHPALHSVGLTALLGISFSLLATFLLVPPCMDWLRSRAGELADGGADRLVTDAIGIRKQLGQIFRYQGPYVTQFVHWKTKIDPLFRALEPVVPRQCRILDLGCGYGIAAHWLTLASPNRTVIGLDHDAEKIRVASATRPANPRVYFENRDVLYGEYPPCDCVLLCDVLHYFPRELKAKILRKAYLALSSGGCLVLRDACRNETTGHRAVDWAERWAVFTGQNRTLHGLHFESAGTHIALLREAGFSPVDFIQAAGLGSNLMMVARKP